MTFQIGSVLLDACVLAILAKEDTYGYRLTQQIKETLGVSESTLYPVLRRLQKEELLETYDVAVMGRNRRYYRLTDEGLEKNKEYKREWVYFSRKITTILEGGNFNDEKASERRTIGNLRRGGHGQKSKILPADR